MIDNVKNNSIIICNNNYKKQILKNIKKLINIKFMNINEFIKSYYFDYDEKSVLYLIKKYNIKYEIALEYLNNLIYIESKEYDFGEDRLHSFKVAGQLLKSTPEEALLGYLTKHIMSIYDMVPEADKFTYNKFNEKITDTINYLLLLKGLLKEKGLGYEENRS